MGARADILCWTLHWGGGLKDGYVDISDGYVDISGSIMLLGVGT